MGKWKLWPPVKSKPLNRLTDNLSWLITSTRGTCFTPNLVIICSRRPSGQSGEILISCDFLFNYYATAPRMRVWRLSDVCLSGAYIGPKSRTERPRKTKIGTEVAHVTKIINIGWCSCTYSKNDNNVKNDTWLGHHFQGQKVKGQLEGGGAYCGGHPHSLFFPGRILTRAK